MAEVYRARMFGPDGFEKVVCIKRILPDQSSNPGFEAMFRDEARLAALLRHANIVQVFDYDRDEDGRLFICMEFIEGVNLKYFLVTLSEKGIQPGPEIVAAVARGALEGLHHAWTALHDGRPLRVIHRDISPHNILLSTSGELKIADFGIAKAFISSVRTRAGVVKGKSAYMSPEQAAGIRLDGRSDLNSLGVILWEMLAGRRLFPARRDAPWLGLLPQNRVAPPIGQERSDVPPGLARLVDALLEVDRRNRPDDASQALEMLMESGVVPAFANKIESLVKEAMPLSQPLPDPAVLPTEPDPSKASTVPDEPDARQTPGSPPEPLDSNDILTEAMPGKEAPPAAETVVETPEATPPAITSKTPARSSRRAGGRGLVVPAAIFAGVALALVLVVTALPYLPGRSPARPDPAKPSPAAQAAPPGELEETRPVPAEPAQMQPAPSAARAPALDRKSKGKGGLDINVKPWAEVYLDGQRVGYTPLSLKKVEAGRHVLRLVNPKLGIERKIAVKVKPGTVRKIALDFHEE